MENGKSNISIMMKWKMIQEIFLKDDGNMKLHIEEKMAKIVYTETTNLKLPLKLVNKG